MVSVHMVRKRNRTGAGHGGRLLEEGTVPGSHGGDYRLFEEGAWFTDRAGRESFYPASVLFRRDGRLYAHIGRERTEDGEWIDTVRSFATGVSKKMTAGKLKKFVTKTRTFDFNS